MDTVIVSNSQFYSHFPSQIPKGSVNAEQVEIRLDKSWDGLTVFWHWKNLGTGVEKRDLLKDPASPHDIPWEVLTDLGELRMGLVGMDGDTVIKPTIWLAYGYVSDGVDPESGSDPQPPTPSWEQQMVEQATQANEAAQAAQKAAEEAAESVASAGPYAEEARKSAEAAKASETAAKGAADTATQQATKAQEAVTSIGNAVDQAQSAATAARSAQRAAETAKEGAAQSAGTAQSAAVAAVQSAGTAQDAATKAGEYMSGAETAAGVATDAAIAAGQLQQGAQTAAQEAANARDQATTAATTAQDHATAADTAKTAAEQAATNAGTAQSGAAQSAQESAESASDAQKAKEAAEAAAAILPTPTPEDAGKFPMVNPEGDGYIFGEAGGGDVGGELLLAEYIHQGNQEIHFASFDWETGIGECTEPHGLSEATEVFLVPSKANNGSQIENIKDLPAEWVGYNGKIYLLPLTETSVRVVGSDKVSQITVNSGATNNTQISVDKFHFETKTYFSIKNLNADSDRLRIEILSYSQYGYFTLVIGSDSGQFYVPSPVFSPVNLYNNKSYHGYLYSVAMEINIYDGMYASWCDSSGLAKALSYSRNAFWVELTVGPIQLTNADNKSIKVINSISAVGGSNTIHNGGVVRVWGRRPEA